MSQYSFVDDNWQIYQKIVEQKPSDTKMFQKHVLQHQKWIYRIKLHVFSCGCPDFPFGLPDTRYEYDQSSQIP